MLFTCARSIHINTDRKQLKQVLQFALLNTVQQTSAYKHVALCLLLLLVGYISA
jgi:hypothetical protein